MLKCKRESLDEPQAINPFLKLKKSVKAFNSSHSHLVGSAHDKLVDLPTERLLQHSISKVANIGKQYAIVSDDISKKAQNGKLLNNFSLELANLSNEVENLSEVIAPIPTMPEKKNLMLEKSKAMKNLSKNLLENILKENLPEEKVKQIKEIDNNLQNSLAQLENALDSVKSRAVGEKQDILSALRCIQNNSDNVMNSVGNRPEIEKRINSIQLDLKELLENAKKAASNQNGDINLLEASQKISKEVENLLACSRPVIDNPKNINAFRNLLSSCFNVSKSIKEATGSEAQWIPYDYFNSQAKEVLACITELSIATAETISKVMFFISKSAHFLINFLFDQLDRFS